jgi:hypothetical protein
MAMPANNENDLTAGIDVKAPRKNAIDSASPVSSILGATLPKTLPTSTRKSGFFGSLWR